MTFRTAAAAEAISRARQLDGLVVGAGTILSVHQVRDAINAGAHSGVAPGTNPDVVAAAQAAGWPFFPGVATPSEIDRARSSGDHVAEGLLRGSVGGARFLKAVAAVYPRRKFVPTGGIDTRITSAKYIVLANVWPCGGSWLVTDSLLRGPTGKSDEIERLAREAWRGVHGICSS